MTTPIPAEALEELNRLAAQERAIQDAVDDWWVEHVLPRVTGIKHVDELRAVFNQIQITDEERQIQDLPGNMHVNKCFVFNQLEFTGEVGYEPRQQKED